jgi:hypothetical protein
LATSLFYSTEDNRLGMRVAITLPKSRILSWLALPLLPGGARGLIFFVGSSLLVFSWMLLLPLIGRGSLPFTEGGMWMPLVILSYGILYLGIPGGLLGRLSDQLWARHMTRVLVIIFFLSSLILPALVGYLFKIDSWGDFEHPGNIFGVLEYLARNDFEYGRGFILMLCMLGLTLLVNTPRLIAMVKEQHKAISNRQWALKQAKEQ